MNLIHLTAAIDELKRIQERSVTPETDPKPEDTIQSGVLFTLITALEMLRQNTDLAALDAEAGTLVQVVHRVFGVDTFLREVYEAAQQGEDYELVVPERLRGTALADLMLSQLAH